MNAQANLAFCSKVGTTYYFYVDAYQASEVGTFKFELKKGIKLCGKPIGDK